MTNAVCLGHSDTVRVLLEAGAEREQDVKDKHGGSMGSLVHVAATKGYSDITRLLLTHLHLTRREGLKRCRRKLGIRRRSQSSTNGPVVA